MRKEAGIKIDPGFSSAIPALQESELALLEASIKEEGCRDPLIVWETHYEHDVLLDGHNRYEICMRLGLPFKVEPMEFESRSDAMRWVLNNQLGRRNLNSLQRTDLIGKKYNLEKADHGGDRKSSTQNEYLKTIQRFADAESVGHATIQRSGEFSAALVPRLSNCR